MTFLRRRFRFGVTAKLGLALSLCIACLLASAPLQAGDQDGVTGYRFKIYDPDGDGIDGNEAGSTEQSGTPSLATGPAALEVNKTDELFLQHVRWLLLLRWLR